MELWIIWTIAAALLLITEVMTQMMWALCLSIGAVAALVLSLSGMDLGYQLTGLIVICLVAYVVLLPYFRRRHARAGRDRARTGMDALLGRRATVTKAIRPGELGRARIDGDNWQVRAPGIEVEIPEGAEVSVTAYDSIILTVADPSKTKPLKKQ